ncbi:MAG: hypothetical protein WBG01_00785 [Bacteroidota bacterium]
MRESWRLIVVAGMVGVLLSVQGCKDEITSVPGESPSDIVFPVRDVSYLQHVQPLFNQACALSGCHDDGPHPSQLRLTSYQNLMFNSLQVVVRGEPDQSVLVFRIEGSLSPRMPLNMNALNQNQINGIRTWIVEGALNN